jgi:parallel beta-helix repeat protein
MPTTKLTSFVCVMLTAAMLWSSLGVGLNATPQESSPDTIYYDAAVANTIAKPDVPVSTTDNLDQNKINANGGQDSVITNSGGGNSEPSAAPWGNWSYRDAHNVPEVENMGYTGDGVQVAVADTGIDFGAQNLAGKYMVDDTTLTVTDLTLVEAAVSGLDNVSLPNTNIVSGSLVIKINGTATTSFTADLTRGEVDFTSVLPFGSKVVCSYEHRPYYGWPVAFDALGLPQYLLAKEARTGGGGVANTTLNGTGPFNIDHTIKVDGKKDFTITEAASPMDKNSDVKTNGTAAGLEFDLTELWGTRDSTFWYAGIPTRYGAINRTFGFAMDFDGAASGSVTDPKGNLLDFEASHSAPIEQLAFDANHGWLASAAAGTYGDSLTGDFETNMVKIWDTNGILVQALPNEQYRVDAVTWSPDGEKLAYATGLETVVYYTSNWTEQWRKPHSVAEKSIYYRGALTFSPNGATLITGSIAASNRIFIMNVLTGSTNDPVVPLDTTSSVAYNPNGTLVALGLANGRVQIINSTDYSTLTVLKTYINKAADVEDAKPIQTLAWSPDGLHLATGRQSGGYINIWNLSTNMTWGDNNYNLTGHANSQSVSIILWTSTDIISGCTDGTVIYWNPTTFALVTTRNSRGNSPVFSLALSPANDIFVGTKDCTIRKYPSTWASYMPFATHKPDIMVYVRYEREYYKTDKATGITKLDVFDKIYDPDVYKWNTATSSWSKTNMTNIFGKAFYKGYLGGEWTQEGILEIALPRNFTAWPDQNTMYITSFICGDNSSRPQDTVPADCNVPSPTIPTYVNWVGTQKTTLSAWGKINIPKTTIITKNATNNGIPSATGKYHFGYHPSAALTSMFGLVPIVVTESTTEGVWDRIYVDMNRDYIIDANDPYVDKNNPVLTIDIWNISTGTALPGPDGIPDLSGGMVYFIGDGKTMMPYSERMSEILVLSGDQITPFGTDNPMPIPKNGEVVAFFGEFGYDEEAGTMLTHGTQTASAIAGEGLNNGKFGPVKGISPDIKFLPICNAQYSLKYALYFAVEGYDGKTNTGDEAQIVSIGQYITGYGNGFDETTYLVEYLVNSTQSNVVFVSPAGNDGSGYGTIAAPCGMNTLVVGFAEDNTFVASGGNTQHYGAVSELSSRGPTAAGLAKPDVIAIGLGEVDTPLGLSGSLAGSIGGMSQTTDPPWKGSDLAAAVTSGVMALIFEAYKDKTGSYPTTQVAMDIIRSSSRDLGYDALTQGSGFVDALAAVRMAKGESGLIVSAPQTSFGNTFGSDYESFINVLDRGDTGTISVNVKNPTATTQAPAYDIEYLQRINVSEIYTEVHSTQGYKGDISNMFPANAEVIKVTAQTNYTDFLTKRGSFFMRLWDWVDTQPPGDPQHDKIDVDEISYLAGVEYGMINSLICTISNPQGKLAGKLVIELAPDMSAGSILPSKVWKITMESFATVPWSWATLSKTSSSIGANSNDNVSVQVNVPTNAQSGTYEAAFVSSYGPTPVNWVSNVQPTSIDEEEYLNTTLYTTYWDDGVMGNYWNDWTAPDANTDGIVDNPYAFNTAGKADLYPLVNPVNTYSSARVSAAPIVISSNADFATYAARGDGTAGNPWIIENLDINGSAYSISCISITDTSDYFIIQGCYLHEAQAGTSGVYLTNVENGVFENNNISMNTYDGIFVDAGCSNMLINNNTMYMNGNTGMDVVASEHISINSNIISYNQGTIGIYMSGTNITIAGNSIHNNSFGSGSYGIIVESAAYSYILGNKFNSDDTGLYASGMENSEIAYNEFDICPSGSIFLDSSFATCQNNVIHHNDILDLTTNAWDDGTNVWDNGTDGNYWNGAVGTPYSIDGGAGNQDNFPLVAPAYKHMTYQMPHAPISITSDADFTLANGVVNPTAAGTLTDPFIISGWEINSTAAQCGILIQNTNAFFVVMNCKIYGNTTGFGIMFSNANNGVVRSNELYSLCWNIRVFNSRMFTVSQNDAHDATFGIMVQNSNNGTVSFNEVRGNYEGIRIWSSETCTVMANAVNDNSYKGIYVLTSNTISIHNNTAANNFREGIQVEQSSGCIVAHNTVDSNVYGINLANATGFNWIFHNNLIGNTVQAYDDFIGDTLASFEMFSYFGTPVDYYSVYDVKQYTVTVNGILIANPFTVNNDTGLVTFTTPICGISGGAIVSIKAILTYEENAPTRISLPNQRLTPSAASIKVVVTKLDGSSYIVPADDYVLYKKVGIIEIAVPFKIEKGVAIFANYTFYNRTGIVPLTLNVLAAETAEIKFGDMGADDTALGIGIMPVWGVRAGQGTSLESGDRRYFYLRIPNQGMFGITELANFYLYSELMWELYQTDINIVVYGKGATALYTKAAPYIMTKLGGSEEKVDFSFLTATGGPKDILVTPFNHEILTICVSAKSFNGTGESITKFEGKSGWIKLSDNNPKAWTNNMVGQASVSFQSSVDLPSGIFASVVGPAQGTKTVEEIYQDDLTLYDLSTMEGWLTMNAVAGFTKVVTVKNALSWDVHIIGHPECVDLDLAIFYDGLDGQPNDGIAQWQEIITKADMKFDAYGSTYGTGTYAYSADADADEAVKFINPPDGDYIIKVLGFTVTTKPGYFDLDVKSIFAGVEGYKITQKETQYVDVDPLNGNYLNTEQVDSFDTRTFNVLWTFPEETLDGVYGGILVFGIPESQKLITISMDIILDREAPIVSPAFTGPNTIVSSATPTISAKIEDLSRGEIDPVGTRVYFDGRDITDLAVISVTQTSNSALQLGYWTGDVIYKSLSPLSEGGHFISIESKDKTGNVATASWGFTVDTIKPGMILSNTQDEIYTQLRNYQLSGTTEPNSIVSFIGVQGIVNQRIDNSFVIGLDLEEGSNFVAIRSTDLAGNTYETLKSITLDTVAPKFNRVVALDGSTTNKRMTGIYGEMTEAGTLELNSVQVPVNSDGTFRYDAVMLVEGQNRQILKFTDRAGNVAYSFMNITLDSIAPTLLLSDIDKIVNSEWLNITGKTEATVASLTINGKLVDVDTNGNFQNSIRLSPGINTIVIESKDRTGNSAQEIMTVVYTVEADAAGAIATNYAAIGLMVALLIVGLVLGLFLAPIILGGKKEEMPEETGTEEDVLPESEEMGAAPEEVVPENIDEAIPESEELEPIPAEESIPDELPQEVSPVETQPEIKPEPAAEDPRIAKLRDAYESGKISKELYEKNLARFKGE